MLPVNVADIILNISMVSERVQEYSSKIILYFQLQNHEYFHIFWCHHCPWVTSTKSKPIYLNPQCNIKFSILINILVNLLPYVLEYRDNIVSRVQYHDMYRIVT